jgi:cobalamin synthase
MTNDARGPEFGMTRPIWRSRWWLPGFSLALGGLMLAAFAIGDRPGEGVKALAVMAAVGAVFLFGRRSDTLQGLGGPGRDERWASIDLKATAFAGLVTITVVLGAWLYEVADGRDGDPYGQLASIAGIGYVLAVVVLRHRG